MVKRFVLDTNILLDDANNVFGFADNTVIITGTTLQELDSKKKLNGDIGFNARECCRILDELRLKGNFITGIRLENGGKLIIEPNRVKQEFLPDGFNISVPDNRIISSCIYLNKNNIENKVILVTNDISMRINATICGVDVEGYRNDRVEESGYSGHTDINVDTKIIDLLYKNESLEFHGQDVLLENEFVTLHGKNNQSALSIYRNGKLKLIKKQVLFGNVKPMNAMQTYAMYALKVPAEEIPLVILKGPAGTAKTFLSLAAGLDDTYVGMKKNDSKYYKLLISRPDASSYDSVGFLPGSLNDKLGPLLAPYFDNMEALLSGNNNVNEKNSQIQIQIDDMLESGIVEICALNFIRGRSLQNCYIICDEAQNASKALIRDVITRAGRGTKVVICGDAEQIDVPTLDKRNCGLTAAVEAMKNTKLAAIIEFNAANSVRSDLAQLAIQKMKI